MFIDILTRVFEENRPKDAIVWKDTPYSHGWLLDEVRQWGHSIRAEGIKSGAVTVLDADFSPNAIALFLALVEHGCIVLPIVRTVGEKKEEFIQIAQGEIRFTVDEDDNVQISKLPYSARHDLYDQLRQTGHPGLVLFSSGSTGKSKGVVHDMVRLLQNFKASNKSLRTIAFMLFDHIGGMHSMLQTLSSGGCVVTIGERSPDPVLAAVARHRVELLTISPTFLNLILLSEAYKRHDLSSLTTVTYGTEPMPESTLKKFHELFPRIRLLQSYGMSEVGILRSKSAGSDSLWVKLGGERFQTRVVNGVLHIKADSAMLGYINAPSLFTDDGWLNTEDVVEVDGEHIKILGRKSDIINVGGEKVYPAEVEDIIQSMDNVAEAAVYGERNLITGNIVCARVSMLREEDAKAFTRRLKEYCAKRLQSYKVPVKVALVQGSQHSQRFKKIRNIAGDGTLTPSPL